MAPLLPGAARTQARRGMAREITEWIFVSAKPYKDPFSEIEMDVIFRDPQGKEQRVPAFWAGGQEARALRRRCRGPSLGRDHLQRQVQPGFARPEAARWRSRPSEGANPLLSRGPVRVAPGHRHLEHVDGTPFVWLADTWWMAYRNACAGPPISRG
jgi:hypothetical protein